MNTLKNFAFGMCLCGTFGLGLTLLGSCTSSGGKTETVMSDSVDAEQGNAVVEAIMSRRSIRKYKDQPVEREKLETIVNCGINAPSGMNRQPWQVRVVDNADWNHGGFQKSQSEGGRRARFQEYVPKCSGRNIHRIPEGRKRPVGLRAFR